MAVLEVSLGSTGAVLAIDMAAPEVGVAVVARASHDDIPTVLYEWTERVQRKADAMVLPAVGEALEAIDASSISLMGVAVTVGPGTFTGLRVGLASALGVAVARHVPVFTMGSLEARALLVPERPLLVLLDARKKRFYGQWFDVNGPEGPPQDAALETFLRRQGVAVGEGARVAADAVTAAGLTVVRAPGSSPVVALAKEAIRGTLQPVDAAEVGLRYVRPPDAKRPTHVLRARAPGG